MRALVTSSDKQITRKWEGVASHDGIVLDLALSIPLFKPFPPPHPPEPVINTWQMLYKTL